MSKLEQVTLYANGQEFTGWERVVITAGINIAARKFNIQTAEAVGKFESPFDVWNFPPFTVIGLYASGDLMISGFVDDYMPAMGAEFHTVNVRGRGLSGTLVDSSPVHPTGTFEDQTVQGIIGALAAPFGVPVGVFGEASKIAGQVVERFQLRRGETVWSEGLRLLGDFGATLMGNNDGSMVIARASPTKHAGGIAQFPIKGMETIPIQQASALLTGQNRFSTYTVTWQNANGVEDLNIFGQTKATDGGVSIFKHKEVMAATELNAMRARALASWNASRAAGLGCQAQIVVPGWRDTAGVLWQPGNLVFVHSPFLKIESDMCITEAEFTQDNEGGTVTALKLSDPRAFGLASVGLSQSGPVWDFNIIPFFGG